MSLRLPGGKPTNASLSAAFGFTVPEAFVTLIRTLYELSGEDATRWPDWFATITGLELVGADFRYPNTPPELFTFAQLGVDGVHYGYVIHAPESSAQDYPVGELSPMDNEGVVLVGADTFDALENLMSGQLDYGIQEPEGQLIGQVSRRLDLHPTAEKSQLRYDPEGNGLPVRPRVPDGWSFALSSDGIGVLAPGEAFRRGNLIETGASTPAEEYIEQADQALGEGFPATALYYLREGYWQYWTDTQIATAIDVRLGQAYRALSRATLAEMVEHRSEQRKSNWR
jgi:hypothetical protein